MGRKNKFFIFGQSCERDACNAGKLHKEISNAHYCDYII